MSLKNYTYYNGKIYYFGNKVVGTGIYNRYFLQKQNQSINKLQSLINISKNKCWWHVKAILVEIIVFLPGLLNPVIYCKYGLGLLIINHTYGILAYVRNYIQLTNNKQLKKSFIDNQIRQNILKWVLLSRRDDNNNNKIVFIISNVHFENLVFVFQNEKYANEFLNELDKLEIDKIINMANDINQAVQLYDDFIKNKILNAWTNYYYYYIDRKKFEKN